MWIIRVSFQNVVIHIGYLNDVMLPKSPRRHLISPRQQRWQKRLKAHYHTETDTQYNRDPLTFTTACYQTQLKSPPALTLPGLRPKIYDTHCHHLCSFPVASQDIVKCKSQLWQRRRCWLVSQQLYFKGGWRWGWLRWRNYREPVNNSVQSSLWVCSLVHAQRRQPRSPAWLDKIT